MSQRYVHRSVDAVLNALSHLSGHKTEHSGEIMLGAGVEGMSETRSDNERLDGDRGRNRAFNLLIKSWFRAD